MNSYVSLYLTKYVFFSIKSIKMRQGASLKILQKSWRTIRLL